MGDFGINPFDVVIILCLVAGVVIGMLRGLVRMVLSLVVLYISAVLALTFHVGFGNWLFRAFQLPRQVSLGVAFVAILIVTSAVINFILRRTYKETELPGIRQIDQLGGIVVGFFLSAFWIGFGVLIAGFFLSASMQVGETPTNLVIFFRRSTMVTMFYRFVPVALATLRPWMPKGLPPEIFTTRL